MASPSEDPFVVDVDNTVKLEFFASFSSGSDVDDLFDCVDGGFFVVLA